MLIDNKIDYSAIGDLSGNGVKTVLDFIRKYTSPESGRKGQLDIVTGFFTIAGLDLLYKELSPGNKYRLVLSELAGDDDFMSRIINLLHGDLGIEATLRLSQAAQNAVAFLKRETVEVKAISSAFCHAKAYVYNDSADDTHDYYVMGSSNLTEAGLGMRESSNVELNFANTGSTNPEYHQLRQWFNTQWKHVAKANVRTDPKNENTPLVDVKQYFIERIEECFGRTHTPEEIYYKILFELFGGDLDIDDGGVEHTKEMTLLQDSTIYRTLFDYQKKGVVSLIKMLRKWNGAILADAVGLGKTFSALAVIKYFQNNGYQTLLLCPKKLEQNWKQYLRKRGSRFDRDEFDYEVKFHTDLQDDRMEKGNVTLSWLLKQPKLLVVVDESHNLRNDKSSRYQMLLNEILIKTATDKVRDVKVLLLSATPINNGLLDIRNQFKLIAQGDNAAFNTDDFQIANLEQLFQTANKRFNEWCHVEGRTIKDFIDTLPPNFFNLTDKLIVARTRNMIEKTLGEDLGFPKKHKPANEYVGLASIGSYETITDVYDAMLSANLTAYQPTQYMKAKSKTEKNWDDNTFREKFLVKMMAVLFMKRLESCWYSCLTTINKVLKVHEETLEKVNAFLKRRGSPSLEVSVPDGEDDDDSEEDFTLRDATIDLARMERIQDFRKDLENDVRALNDFYGNLVDFQAKFEAGEIKDTKLERLIEILSEKQGKPNRKAIVFTTFGDTAKYLYEQIGKAHPEWRIACVTGQKVMTSEPFEDAGQSAFLSVLQRFAPYSKLYKEKDWSGLYIAAGLRETHYDPVTRKWSVDYDLWRAKIGERGDSKIRELLENEIDILIATDCLSEGQNLQDSDLVINYDIHWNPVRLIQRFGRIDRIGSPNSEIGAVNFWPTTSYNEYLNLTSRINNRMALMRLAGTETQPTDAELAAIVKDDPTIDRNTQKLLQQISEGGIEEIEEPEKAGGSNLGLEDFSLEVFRQELLDYFEKNRELFRRMPSGVFSGFKLGADAKEPIPESLVSVLGYPRRKSGDVKTPYTRLYLMLQPVGNAPAEWKELPTGTILSFLRKHRHEETNLPVGIAQGDIETLAGLSKTIKAWMAEKTPQEIKKTLSGLFSGQVKAKRTESKIEDIFRPENFDLIAWEYISR